SRFGGERRFGGLETPRNLGKCPPNGASMSPKLLIWISSRPGVGGDGATHKDPGAPIKNSTWPGGPKTPFTCRARVPTPTSWAWLYPRNRGEKLSRHLLNCTFCGGDPTPARAPDAHQTLANWLRTIAAMCSTAWVFQPSSVG